MVRFLSILTLLVAFSHSYAQVDDPGLDICSGDGAITDPSCNTGGGGDPVNNIPEPGTLALFGLGVVAVGLMSRRRRK